MSFDLLGYVLEAPRVSSGNSLYTFTPNTVILDQIAFDLFFPQGLEPNPRVEYFVFVTKEGLIREAQFGWSKNENINRVYYDGQDRRFKLLLGNKRDNPGTVTPNSNTQRLKVFKPFGVLSDAPFRLSVGAGSGTSFNTLLVSSFGSPPAGTVEINTTTGELNWNVADLTTYENEPVFFQRQQFFDTSQSDGIIGKGGDPDIFLNPLPASGQKPLLRFEYNLWLQGTEVPNDAALLPAPPTGSFKWSASTGKIKLASADEITYQDKNIYYDGVLFGYNEPLPSENVGVITAPANLSSLPPLGGDLIFTTNPGGHQFRSFKYVQNFSVPGEQDVVEVRISDGALQFSTYDQALYSGQTVDVVFGDYPIERGLGYRFFRSIVNPSGSTSIKDVTNTYEVSNATLADPIIASPIVFLPSLPITGSDVVRVVQKTGSFVGILNNLETSNIAGLGYVLDYKARTLTYGRRRENVLVPVTGAFATLSDPSLLGTTNVSIETAPNSNQFTPLIEQEGYLVDKVPAIISFIQIQGKEKTRGEAGYFSSSNTFKEDFNNTAVTFQDLLVIDSGTNEGVYSVTTPGTVSSGVLIDAPVSTLSTDDKFKILSKPEILADRFWEVLEVLDPDTKIQRILSLGIIQNSTLFVSGLGSFTSTKTMTTGASLVGVVAGDTLKITTGPDAGSYRIITIVGTNEITVDRNFISFSNANFEILKSLKISDATKESSFKVSNTFLSNVTHVATDGDFTALAAGQVQISNQTGNLNFSASDLVTYAGMGVFWYRTLERFEYKIQAGLGLIEFEERFLTNEKVIVQYRPIVNGIVNKNTTVENGTFIVRKEITTPFPRTAITNKVKFNPTNKTVASNPGPSVYRGGRPQNSSQVKIDLITSTITFLPDTTYQTDTLPHGANLGVSERVYVDYFVLEAFGGEKTITLQFPMEVLKVPLVEGANTIKITGNQVSLFPSNHLLRVDSDQVYEVTGSVYNVGSNETTVTLLQTIKDTNSNPKLQISSGVINRAATLGNPSYYLIENNPFYEIPRGTNKIKIFSDVTLKYPTGTVIYFSPNFDMHIVAGSEYKDTVTTITLNTKVSAQYLSGINYIYSTVRPILEQGNIEATTKSEPLLTQSHSVIKKKAGQKGNVLHEGSDYTISDGGYIRFKEPLKQGETWFIAYTGLKTYIEGTRAQVSYGHLTVPDNSNGLLNQRLEMDYEIFAPDSFFNRVEKLSNFIPELSQYLEDQALGSNPQTGPIVENAAETPLFEKGAPSLFFDETHIANQDIAARAYLKFLNDNINHLEDTLQDFDGRLVGSFSGRFLFDGKVNNPIRTNYAQVTNEIDDTFKTSEFPVTYTFPPLTLNFQGTFEKLYTPNLYSRFYPIQKYSVFDITVAGSDTSASTGDPIVDLGLKNIVSSPPTINKRLQRALVLQDAKVGDSNLFVDNAEGTSTYKRPPFGAGMSVVIKDSNGSFLVPDTAPLTVVATSSGPDIINIGSLPVDVPRGSTVFLNVTGPTPDTNYYRTYRNGFDLTLDNQNGLIKYVKPYFPFDGSVPLIPTELCVQAPTSNEILELFGVGFTQTETKPFRFPALDGISSSDNNDIGIPIKIKTFYNEIDLVADEFFLISQLTSNTTPTSIHVASLDITNTIITKDSGNWPAPTPQIYDLITFTTGPNTGSFHRIIAVTPNTVTVDWPFPSSSTSETVLITTDFGTIGSGTCTFPTAFILDDPGLTPNIKEGYTVVFTSGPNAGARRNVISIVSPTQVLLDFPIPNLVVTNYRISNPISTYSNLQNLLVNIQNQNDITYNNDHNLNPLVLNSEYLSITRFLDGDTVAQTSGILTNIVSPNPGTAAGTILTGTTDFIAANVNSSHFVLVETGSNLGCYQIASIDSPTQITLANPFPFNGAITYRIVKAYNANKENLETLLNIREASFLWHNTNLNWLNLLTTTLPVITAPSGSVDPNIYATQITSGATITRIGELSNRQSYITTTPTTAITSILKTEAFWYDFRYTWIDARINLVNGFLFLKQRAIEQRLKNLEQQKVNLTKLLSQP